MPKIRDFVTFGGLLIAGFLTTHPPYSGAGFVALPLIYTAQKHARLLFPWYVAAYFLGVGLTIPFAVADVGSGASTALAIWAGYALLAAIVSLRPRVIDGPVSTSVWAYLPLSLPPLGFVFVAPPLSASGWWYPGTGVLGPALLVWLGAASVRWFNEGKLQPLLAPITVAIVANLVAIAAPSKPLELRALSIPVEQPPTNLLESLSAAIRFSKLIEPQYAAGARVVVLPENVLGAVTPAGIRALGIPNDHALLAGGFSAVPWADQLQKGVWLLPEGVFYPAIQPIPVIEPGLHPHWRGLRHTATVAGNQYSLLVCFEAATSLPLFHMHYGTGAILVGNGWWDRSGIMKIEISLAQQWARLFQSEIAVSEGQSSLQKRAFFD